MGETNWSCWYHHHRRSHSKTLLHCSQKPEQLWLLIWLLCWWNLPHNSRLIPLFRPWRRRLFAQHGNRESVDFGGFYLARLLELLIITTASLHITLHCRHGEVLSFWWGLISLIICLPSLDMITLTNSTRRCFARISTLLTWSYLYDLEFFFLLLFFLVHNSLAVSLICSDLISRHRRGWIRWASLKRNTEISKVTITQHSKFTFRCSFNSS